MSICQYIISNYSQNLGLAVNDLLESEAGLWPALLIAMTLN